MMRRVYSALISLILVSILVLNLPLPRTADGWVMDKLNGTADQKNLTFDTGGGEDDSAIIQMRQDVPVYRATMGVRVNPDDAGTYPRNLWMDVGHDGDYEWMFTGTGYGSFGEQTRFSDNSTSIRVPFRGDEENDTFRILLPKGAVVSEASMDVVGIAGINDGLLTKREDGGALAWAYSSTVGTPSFRPKLTVVYEGGSIVIQPDEAASKDARIQQGAPGTNYEGTGTASYLIYSWTGNSNSNGLMQFDLSAIPQNAKIYDAKLEVIFYSYQSGQDWGIHEVTEAWDENTVTWNSMPNYEANTEDVHNISAQYAYETADWNITDLMKVWMAETFPNDVSVDMGLDSNVEYSMSGELNTSVSTGDFSTELNKYLISAPADFIDDYGNPFVEVPVGISSSSTGIVKVRDLSIEYDWVAKVFKNPHNNNLTNEIVEHMSTIPPQLGLVNIPVNVYSESAGKVTLMDVNVTYNGPPKLIALLPSDTAVDEDTAMEHALDLSDYFLDDFLPPDELKYKVVANSEKETIAVDVVEGHYLSVDATIETARDWNGVLAVKVEARDEMGFTKESDEFGITITAVNDEPVKGEEPLPNVALKEGGQSTPLNLDARDYFRDADGDGLIFSAEVDPLGSYEGENLSAEVFNDTKDLVINAHGDFFGADIPLRIFCDDGIGEYSGVYRDIYVHVSNLNDDPPVWGPIPTVHVPEDQRSDDAFSVEDFVTDVDNKYGDLRITLAGNTNESQVKVSLDPFGSIDIVAAADNWTGESTVTLKATDDGNNEGETDFLVVVDPVNDLPVAIPLTPKMGSVETAETVELTWEGVDAETPSEELLYDLYISDTGPAILVAEGISDNSYTLDVQDMRTYRWTVAASDDEGTKYGEKASERSFTVDFSAGSRTILDWPRDRMVLKGDTAQLGWSLIERPNAAGGSVWYDIHMGKTEDSMELVAEGVTATEYDVSGLTDNTWYFWEVIPRGDRGTGTCMSGVWEFSMDSGFAGYDIGLSVEPAAISLDPGQTGAVTVTLTNTGGALDEYTLVVEMTQVPGAEASLTPEGDEGVLLLDEGASANLTATLQIPSSTAQGTYSLSITALSVRGGMSRVEVVDVTVGEEEVEDTTTIEPEAKTEDDWTMASIIILIVVIVMAALLSLAFMMYKSKSRRVRELEGKSVLTPTMVEAELSMHPTAAQALGTPGAVPATQQLGTGAGGPGAIGAAAQQPKPLALPSIATGGVAPGGVTPSAPTPATIDVPSSPTASAPAPAPAPKMSPKPGDLPPSDAVKPMRPPPPKPKAPTGKRPITPTSGKATPKEGATPDVGKGKDEAAGPKKEAAKEEKPGLGILPKEVKK